MFAFDPPENSRKPLVFCFQGDQKGTSGRRVKTVQTSMMELFPKKVKRMGYKLLTNFAKKLHHICLAGSYMQL